MAGCVLGTPLAISAGASGGIMGLGAFLFSLALLQAPIALKLNTKTLGFVMAINLLMGFAVKEIDHAGAYWWHTCWIYSWCGLSLCFVLSSVYQFNIDWCNDGHGDAIWGNLVLVTLANHGGDWLN